MKILVIRFSSLGDVVLSTAVFPSLRAHYPDAEISVLTRLPFVDIFNGNPHLDHVMVFDPDRQSLSQLAQEIRAQAFDLIIDLQGNVRSWLIRVLAGTPRAVAVEKRTLERRLLVWTKKKAPALETSVRERNLNCLSLLEVPITDGNTHLYPENATPILETLGLDPTVKLIGIAPGARHNTKRWPIAKFVEAANRLGEIPGAQVVILGDKSDRIVADTVFKQLRVPCRNLAGWTSLKDLIAIVSRLSLLVTNDSGILHIGEALAIPLVAIFGPTVRGFGFAPYRPTSRVVEVVNLGCRPCTLHGDERCPLTHHRCMEDIEVDAVLYATSETAPQNASTT